MPNFFVSLIDSSRNGHYTISTWSFLIVLDKKLSDIPDKEGLFYSLLKPTSEKYKDYRAMIRNSVELFKSNASHKQRLLVDLPLNSALEDYIDYREIEWGFYLAWVIFIALLLGVGYFFVGRYIRWSSVALFIRRSRITVIGLLLLIVLYLVSMELLIYSEELYYQELGEKSKLLNMTRTDLHSWMFVIMATGNSNNIFPLSLLGKFIVTFNAMFGLLGAAFVSISQFITYRIERKRKEGIMKTKFKNHIIIFGWNGTTDAFVKGILEDSKEYMNKMAKIVCVVPDINEVLEKFKNIKRLHEEHIIDIIQGDARDKIVLERANVENASTVILLSEDNTKISDEHVLLRAMAISRYVRKIKGKSEDSIYMIAEVNNPSFKESLIEADVNEVVISGSYTKSIMKQAIFNHGVSKVLDEVLQYNEYNEFYKVDLSKPENRHLIGRTFDELLVALRRQGILLVGIHVIFWNDKGEIIIDQEKIKELLQKEENGLKRDIIVNPIEDIEVNRRTDNNDQLIVLGYSYDQLRNAIKNVRFD